MTVSQVVDFLNREQRDPRLNEILCPYADAQKAREIIAQYEPNRANVQKGQRAHWGTNVLGRGSCGLFVVWGGSYGPLSAGTWF